MSPQPSQQDIARMVKRGLIHQPTPHQLEIRAERIRDLTTQRKEKSVRRSRNIPVRTKACASDQILLVVWTVLVALAVVAAILWLTWPRQAHAAEARPTIVWGPPRIYPIPPAGPLWGPERRPLWVRIGKWTYRILAERDGTRLRIYSLRVKLASTSRYERPIEAVWMRRYRAGIRNVPFVGRWERTGRKGRRRSLYGPWHVSLASWYWEPQSLAAGGYLTPRAMIFAHKTMRFGAMVQFRYRRRRAAGTCRDRGPYAGDRVFDLGPGLAGSLGFDGVDVVWWRRFLGRQRYWVTTYRYGGRAR